MTNDTTKLWATHVVGPDDLLAARSKEEAQKQADEINSFNFEYLDAVVIEWPYDAESHALELNKPKEQS